MPQSIDQPITVDSSKDNVGDKYGGMIDSDLSSGAIGIRVRQSPQSDLQKQDNPIKGKYDTLIDEDLSSANAGLQNAQYNSRGKDPEQYAKVLDLARQTGVHPDYAEKNFDFLTDLNESGKRRYPELVKDNPGLARWMQKDRNFAISADDLPALRQVDSAVNRYGKEDKNFSLFGDYGQALGTGWQEVNANLMSYAVANNLPGLSPEYAAFVVSEANKKSESNRQQYPGYYANFQERNAALEGGFEEAAKAMNLGNQEWEDGQVLLALKDAGEGTLGYIGGLMERLALYATNPRSFGYTFTEGLPSLSLPLLTGGLGAGSTGPGAAFFGPASFFVGTVPGSVGGKFNQMLARRGVDINDYDSLLKAYKTPSLMLDIRTEATNAGVVSAALNTWALKLAGRAVGALPEGAGALAKAGAVAKDISALAAGQTAAEVATQAVEEHGDLSKISASKIFDTYLNAYASAIPFEAYGMGAKKLERTMSDRAIVKKTRETVSKANDAQEVIKSAQVISDAVEAIQQSKLEKRSSDSMGDLLKDLGADKTVFFQTKEFNKALEGSDVLPGDLVGKITEDGGGAYRESLDSDGTFEVPLDRLLKEMSKGDLYDKLAPYIRAKEDGPSLTDAHSFMLELPNALSQLIGEASIPAPIKPAEEVIQEKVNQQNEPVLDKIARLKGEAINVADIGREADQQGQIHPYEAQGLAIGENVKAKLSGAGFSEKQASAQSELYSNLFKRIGEQTGVEPAELYRRMNTLVERVSPEALQVLAERARQVGFDKTQFQTVGGERAPLLYEPLKGLGTFERSKELQFARELSNPESVKRYAEIKDTHGGKVLDADETRLLHKDYASGRIGALLNTEITHRPAAAFVQKMFEDRMSRPSDGKSVVFMGGGGGVGKTTVRNGMFGEALSNIDTILDGTLSNFNRSDQNIRRALDSGRPVELVFVYRPIEEAALGAYERFKNTGRYVPPGAFTEGHIESIDSFTKLAKKYEGQEGVNITIFDTSGKKTKIITLDELTQKHYIKSEETIRQAIDRVRPKIEELFNAQTNEIETERSREIQQRSVGESSQSTQADSTAGVEGARRNEQTPGDLEKGPSPELIAADEALTTGEPLFQAKEGEKLGAFFFGRDGQRTIYVSKNANLSTFLHETGHYFYSVLSEAVKLEGASEQLKSDHKTLLDWFGVKSDSEVTAAHQEKFAEAFEGYLIEGKAPSKGMQRVFNTFKVWLTSIYNKFQRQQKTSQLTPEVRGVLDRLLASDEEITKARETQGIDPLFKSPETFGLKGEKAEAYLNAVQKANEFETRELTKRALEDYQKDQKMFLREERGKIRDEVKAELGTLPEYQARSILERGKRFDGTELPHDEPVIKLNRQLFTDEFGQARIGDLPEKWFAKEGGVEPEAAAQYFGFESGKALLDGLEQTMPLSRAVENETSARMKMKYPDLLDKGLMPQEALKIVHNDYREQVARMEIEHLLSNDVPVAKDLIRQVARRLPSDSEIKSQARDYIAERKVKDIKPKAYLAAEARLNKEAGELLAKGEFDKAADAKMKALLNYELYREAQRVNDEVEKTMNYLRKFENDSTRSRIGKAGGEYLEQIDAIISRYDLSQSTTIKEIEKRKALSKFAEEQKELGYDIFIPDSVLNEAQKKLFKDIPYSELSDVRDTIKQLDHLASLKGKLLANARFSEFSEMKDALLSSVSEFHNTTVPPKDLNPSLGAKLIKGGKGFLAAHTKMEFLFDLLDGYKGQGEFWRNLFKPMADAENFENATNRATAVELGKIFGEYSRNERALWHIKKTYIPELDTPGAKIRPSMNKANMIAVALNLRNEYNMEAIKKGYGWTDGQIRAIVSHLDAKDIKTVNAIGKLIESFWPQIAEQERSLNGLVPEKVTGSGYDAPAGHIEGGYYPLKFDSELSFRQAVQDEFSSVQELFGGNWARAATRHGHTKERTDTGGKPPKLDLSVLTDHLQGVTHDLAFRKAVIDVNRIISDPDIRAAVEGAAGKEMMKQLEPWVRGIANDRGGSAPNPIEGLLGRVRSGATVVNLGFKVTSSIVQTLGYSLTVNEIGPKYSAIGIRDAYGNPFKIKDTWQFITSRSEMMKGRIENWDRDVRDSMRKIGVPGAGGGGPLSALEVYTAEVRQSSFYMIGMMDLGTSIPSWLGAYRKAMDGMVGGIEKGNEVKAVDYADSVVRKTQSAGGAKDLASIQRGSEMFKNITMFYSQAALAANQLMKSGARFKIDRNIPRLVASLALTWFLPAVLEQTVKGRAPDPSEDEDKYLKWMLRKEVLYPANSFIFARDIADGLDKYWATGQVGFTESPTAQAIESAIRATSIVGKPLSDQDISRHDIKALVDTVGYATQLPTNQPWKSASYLYDWLSGEEVPETMSEGIYRTAVGARPKNP